ncbi:CMRF35-like molecule 5 [Pelobates cultripes]|uniref:CMRF35-like molecule 5 n=1 Tax=Pelobates cultripes TaxID=61616 RepID=A0AAD1QYJ1_PELCU|nr:CMRF35-like molecule 5 [Pelobates cultripes]
MISVKLTVIEETVSEPVVAFIGNPRDSCVGLPVSIDCRSTTGRHLQYSWYNQRNRVVIGSNTLKIQCDKLTQADEYYCEASNNKNKISSSVIRAELLDSTDNICKYILILQAISECNGVMETGSGTECSGVVETGSGTECSGVVETGSGTECSGVVETGSGTECSGVMETGSGIEGSGVVETGSGTECSGVVETGSDFHQERSSSLRKVSEKDVYMTISSYQHSEASNEQSDRCPE